MYVTRGLVTCPREDGGASVGTRGPSHGPGWGCGVSPYPTIPFPILPHHTRAFHCIPGGEGNRCWGSGHRVLLHSHPGGEEAGVARNRLHLRPWRGKWTTEDCQHSLDLPSRWRIKAACVFPSLCIRNGVFPWRSQSLSFLLKDYFHIARKC